MTANKDQRKVFLLSAILLSICSIIIFIIGIIFVFWENSIFIGIVWVLLSFFIAYASKQAFKAGRKPNGVRK